MFGERRGGFGGRSGGRSGGFGGGRGGFGGGRGGFGGGRRDFGGRTEPAPVKVGEEYDVEISEVSQRGDGVARIKNFVVFVPGTQKGDKVHVKIVDVKGRHAIGEVSGAGSTSSESPAEEVEAAAGEVEAEESDDASEEEEA